MYKVGLNLNQHFKLPQTFCKLPYEFSRFVRTKEANSVDGNSKQEFQLILTDINEAKQAKSETVEVFYGLAM